MQRVKGLVFYPGTFQLYGDEFFNLFHHSVHSAHSS